MDGSCAQKAKCFNKRKKGEKSTVLFSLAVARKSCKSPGRSCYWWSKRLRGDLSASEKISRKLLTPSTSHFPSSNFSGKISCEPPLKQWTKKCRVWSGILWLPVCFQNMFILYGDSVENLHAESGLYNRQGEDTSCLDGNCWTHSIISAFEKRELVQSTL